MRAGDIVAGGRRRPLGKAAPHHLGERGPGRLQAGAFTLVELLLVISVLLIAFLALSQSIVASMALTRVNRESALATDGIRHMVEVLQGGEDFEDLYQLYNGWNGDDPGPGPAPGSGFTVAGLEPVEGDSDGLVGEIVFPTVETSAGLELREDVEEPTLGMPRDLNGDGALDALDHAGDYRLLPVVVRLRWRGVSGERSAEVRTLIADR